MTFPPAPSAAPTSIRVSELTFSSVTVQWGVVDCIHHNGKITGYSVLYGIQGNGSNQTENVTGGDATETIISGLMQSTTHAVQVAAKNSGGTGPYSSPVFFETLESKLYAEQGKYL